MVSGGEVKCELSSDLSVADVASPGPWQTGGDCHLAE